MSTTVALGCCFVLAAAGCGVLGGLVLVYRQRILTVRADLRTARATISELQDDLGRSERDADHLRAELAASLREAERLRVSSQWEAELADARRIVDDILDDRPRPHRNERYGRERNAWIYRMRAAMAAESHVPPHERDGDAR